ncbi:hypothetical protein DOU02_06650 [Clavibacter michiganensis subsp. michiganensis]|uniref:recombinase family protein n=1 Tax=Clavibacter michiganensis TaxID=28447 RepID=UPI0013031D87|nr:recombinase family protein [Clavibacter michiganensis]KAF0258757.1 hypothetical protein DOU02_06650 [Clavibacter michiganensis subsp. michiganensis]
MTMCAVYARQSLDRQQGIDIQLSSARVEAERRGWTIVEEYVDNDTSASKQRGPSSAWGRMLRDATAGRFEFVMATDLDRLLRGQRDLLDLMEAKAKPVLLSGQLDLASADGEFRATMLAAVARFEVVRKAERQVRAADARADRGIPHRGVRPYGWETDGITIRPDEARWVRYVADEIQRGASIASVTRALNEQGVLTTRGNAWSTITVKKMAIRARNAGLLERHGERQEQSLIEPIITIEQLEAVQAILGARRGTPGPQPIVHWASGLASCAVCGAALRGKHVTTKDGRSPWYICETKIKRATNDDRRHVSISGGILEGVLAEAVAAAFLFGGDALGGTADSPANAAHTALSGLQARQAELVGLVSEGLVTGAQIASELRGLKEQQAQLEQTIREAQSRDASMEMLSALRGDLLAGQRVAFGDALLAREALLERFKGMSIERRRQLVEQLLEVTVEKGKGGRRVRIHHRVVESLNEA